MEIYLQIGGSVCETYRALRSFYSRHNRPSEQAIRFMTDKFHTTYSLHDVIPKQDKTINPLKLTILYEVPANRIIGLYLFRNEEGATIAVKRVRYRHMLNNFFS